MLSLIDSAEDDQKRTKGWGRQIDGKMYTNPTTQKNVTCFAPNQVHTHRVCTPELTNINDLF